MRKHGLLLLTACIMAVGILAGCSSNSEETSSTTQEVQTTAEVETEAEGSSTAAEKTTSEEVSTEEVSVEGTEGKTLVVYFSATGNTKAVAEMIAEETNGDLFEIEPAQKYTLEDLDWTNKQSRSSIEMQDKTFRPQILNKVSNITEYDTVVLGFPVWWYTAPTIINTFIEENNLEGKKIYVFVTSGGSSSEGSFRDLKNTYKNLNFISNKRFTGRETDEDYINWIK